MTILPACSADDMAVARALFTEYANEIDVDLSFQNFKQELANLPGGYAPPEGRLLLAWACTRRNQDFPYGIEQSNETLPVLLAEDSPAGCVGLRKLGPHICEMKRLYVCPSFRGQRIGRLLAEGIIYEARHVGYQRMRLDCLPTFTAAMPLYGSLGFRKIPAYYHNPHSDALFLELVL